uniref:Uncharacterized protein n=1 Tax=Anopheles atroparvus TaxID=41427 RepID=A0A182IV36_ANOAO
MGKISGSHCLVLGCRNRQLLNQTNTRSYFRFPRDAELPSCVPLAYPTNASCPFPSTTVSSSSKPEFLERQTPRHGFHSRGSVYYSLVSDQQARQPIYPNGDPGNQPTDHHQPKKKKKDRKKGRLGSRRGPGSQRTMGAGCGQVSLAAGCPGPHGYPAGELTLQPAALSGNAPSLDGRQLLVGGCKKWVDFCSRPELYKKYDENGPEYLYKSSRICSDHFQPTDFNNPNLFSQGPEDRMMWDHRVNHKNRVEREGTIRTIAKIVASSGSRRMGGMRGLAVQGQSGLKKGSIPTVNPATNETKANNGTGAVGGGGSGSSNGAGSPIDDKLLSAVAMSPNLSLIMAAAVAAAQQNHQQQQQQLLQANSALTATYLKRTVAAMSGSGNSSTPNSATTTTTTTSTPGSGGSSSAKRSRAVPPLATPTGALANLIQRQQQIKEQQRKAAALAASGLGNGQVSISAVSGSRTSAANASRAGPISLVTSKKAAAASINNNNNNVSNHNHNHSGGGATGKQNHESNHHDHNEYGVNDVDMTGGETSEGDSSYQNSADEDYAYHQKQKVAKVEAVIPPSLKSQLTVTPATINNNTIIHSSSSTNGGGAGSSPTNGGTINYKEQYEQTLKELFACRKIVKNQNKAIKQLQGEIDFLNQLLKEK